MKHYYNNQAGAAAVWAVGIVAVAALIIAWSAFNRAGPDLIPTLSEEVSETANQAEQAAVEAEQTAEMLASQTALAAARAEARAELLALQTRIEAGEAADEIAVEAEEIEQDLAQTYQNASLAARSQYQSLQAEFRNLENNLRAGTGDALETLSGLIIMLEQDVRSDYESAPTETQ